MSSVTDSSLGTGSGQVGPRRAPGRAVGLWDDGTAPLWPGDPQLIILAFSRIVCSHLQELPQEPSVGIPPFPGLPSLPQHSANTESITPGICMWHQAQSWLCLARAPGPSQHSGCFLKKHRANLSPVKFCCANGSFLMFVIVQFCCNISYLCFFFFLNYS